MFKPNITYYINKICIQPGQSNKSCLRVIKVPINLKQAKVIKGLINLEHTESSKGSLVMNKLEHTSSPKDSSI